MSKKGNDDGLIWANAIVPDPRKGPKARMNLAFRCRALRIVRDGIGGITCVRVIGGARDGLEVFPAYGVSLRKRAPKGRKDAKVNDQGRIC